MSEISTYTLLNVGRLVGGPGSIVGIKDIVIDLGAKKALIVTDKGVAGAGLVAAPKALFETAGATVAVIDSTRPLDEVKAQIRAALVARPQLQLATIE